MHRAKPDEEQTTREDGALQGNISTARINRNLVFEILISEHFTARERILTKELVDEVQTFSLREWCKMAEIPAVMHNCEHGLFDIFAPGKTPKTFIDTQGRFCMLYDDYNDDFVAGLVAYFDRRKIRYSRENYDGAQLKLGDIMVSGLSVHRDKVAIIRLDKRTEFESAFKKWVRRKYPSDDIANDDGFPRTDSSNEMHKYLDSIGAVKCHQRLDELYTLWVSSKKQ